MLSVCLDVFAYECNCQDIDVVCGFVKFCCVRVHFLGGLLFLFYVVWVSEVVYVAQHTSDYHVD